MIEIKVNKSIASVQETEALYSGAVDSHSCHFSFDASWDSFSKSAVFRFGGRAVTALIEDDCCTLPWEILARDNIGLVIEVGVYGVSAETEILTSVWDSIGTVRDGTELGSDARNPSAGIYEQVLASVQRVDAKVDDYNSEMKTLMQRSESSAALAVDSAADAARSERGAENAAAAAQGALAGVRDALGSLPSGEVLVVNDLVTGGAGAALSAEMGRNLGRRPNPNILINTNFLRPVNQRGLTEYSGDVLTYTIDCWKRRYKTAVVTVSDGGVTVSNSQNNALSLAQNVENYEQYAGRTLTLSVLVSDISGGAMRMLVRSSADTSMQFAKTFSTTGLHKVTGVVADDPGQLMVAFYSYDAGASATIRAVKLELGDTQTLAHQDSSGSWVLNEFPDYGEELAKCQRYQMAFPVINSGSYWVGTAQTTQYARIPISLPQSLRAMPSLTAPVGSIDASGFALRHGTTAYEIAEMSAYNMTGNEVTLLIKTAEAALTAGETYVLYSTAASTMLLDANL